ncbi:MAG: hypothetical protein ABSH39_16710 [Candidatus Acidiferrum sp.]|jgi:hypothetical protein
MAKTLKFNDKRRRHLHFAVTIKYSDGQTFVRVYPDEARAAAFAKRQTKSPVVERASVQPLD